MQEELKKPNPLEGVAALVVDLQGVFFEMVDKPDELLASCRFFLQAVDLFDLPIFLTEQVPDKLGHTEKALRELAEEAPVFAKNSFSALGAQGLPEVLKKAGTEHLLLAGVETSICVYFTALEALSSEKTVTVLTDCVSCRRPADGEWALRKLAAAGCHLLPAESVFYGMLGGAGHPHFKAFTKLVRERDIG